MTATAFVVRDDATLLHWHKRLQQWMPPGGHIEPNEDPVQAALREVREETGLVCEIIPTTPTPRLRLPGAAPRALHHPRRGHRARPTRWARPRRPHKHIDMIYFVRPLNDAQHDAVDDPTLRWVTERLRENAPLDVAGCGVSAAIPEDVRQLALAAIPAAPPLRLSDNEPG